MSFPVAQVDSDRVRRVRRTQSSADQRQMPLDRFRADMHLPGHLFRHQAFAEQVEDDPLPVGEGGYRHSFPNARQNPTAPSPLLIARFRAYRAGCFLAEFNCAA
jgi:hypothetical protein